MSTQAESELDSAERRSTLSARRLPTGRTGFILGLIVVALMLALFAWIWSEPGAQRIEGSGEAGLVVR